eukprot:m.112465 g.112465  ORF g.112465 m.112465 type:complete len:60 (-) comp21425_c2_seq4:31-210(-)
MVSSSGLHDVSAVVGAEAWCLLLAFEVNTVGGIIVTLINPEVDVVDTHAYVHTCTRTAR